MAITWRFESDNTIFIGITDQVTQHEIIEFLDEVKPELRGYSEIYELIVCSADLRVMLTSEEAVLVAEKVRRNLSFHESGAIGIVCATDHVYGLSRQLAMRVESDDVKIEVFRTETEARRWLKEVGTLNTA